MRFIFTCLLICFAPIAPGCAAEDSSSVRDYSGFSCIEGCGVTFSEIVSNRSRYDKNKIYISGFIAISNGFLSLQPSEQAYMSSVGDLESIIFNIPESAQKEIIDSHLNSYVSVRGVFNVGSGNELVGIGYFSDNVNVYRKIVREKPEGVEEWKVRLEDLD
ncbi:hypothetical protein LDO31_18925 [Luteimonas sp. XNQY3]|nr:hypothetical protein [Luteimonas sp. XNQY3]MCD9008263.1 hypothetical protein [Luteimonas sp. XNQY3]